MMRKALLAGLMSATLIAGIAPAYAQDHRDGGQRPDWERQDRGQPGPGPEARMGGGPGWQGRALGERTDRGQAAGGNPGWANRERGPGAGWQDRGPQQNGGWRSQPSAVQPPRPDMPRPDMQRADRGWRGDRNPGVVNDWNRRPDGSRAGWRDRNADRAVWNRARDDRRWDGRRDDDRRWNDGRWNNDRDWNQSAWNNGRRFDDRTRWAQQRRWDSGWRQDRRYDWRGYRSTYGDRYRIGRYYAPSGWNYGYSRFSIGVFLGSPLYSDRYWLNDPYEYRLPPAYGTLRWIRYYDDALLVDVRDGYVADVIHDFFW